jgi:vanillate O-demethylase monooxygenase subunit
VIDGCELECPYHGWRYNAEGECTLAPQRPELASHLRARVRRYPAAERFGLIWVSLVEEPHFPLPDYPAWSDPDCHYITVPATDWAASAPRRVENYTDYSHLAIVHDGYLGRSDEPEIPEHEIWAEESRLECRQDPQSWTRVPVEGVYQAMGGEEGEQGEDEHIRYRTDWTLFMPLTVSLTVSFEEGGAYFLLFHPTPIGAKRIRNFTIASRNFGDPARDEEEVATFETMIYEQDRPVVESQRPEELPEDLSAEMHLKGVDTFSIQYRRWLVELAKELDDDPGADPA